MKDLTRKVKNVFRTLSDQGVAGLLGRAKQIVRAGKEKRDYRRWVARHGSLNESMRREMRESMSGFKNSPLISLIVPVFNTEERWLRACIESVLRQVYTNWELCIADDFSDDPNVKRILDEYAASDPRVKITFRDENGHISKASNSALEIAAGEYAALLDHDDELSEDALFWVVNEINRFPGAKLVYSDEDKIDVDGSRTDPFFKPDWSPNLFYSMNYLNHLTVYRTDVIRNVGGFRSAFNGSQDYDLALRVIELIGPGEIRHIPRILYHWRAAPGSVALDSGQKDYAHEIARDALREHFGRRAAGASVERGFGQYHRVVYPFSGGIELIIGESAEELNNAAEKSGKDVFVFIQRGILTPSNEAALGIAAFAAQERIGAAGGKVLNANGTIRNCGIISVSIRVNAGMPSDHPGRFGAGMVIADVDAVEGVLAVRRDVFHKIGGFKGKDQDFMIDFCGRLKSLGYGIVFTPYAVFESAE